MKCENCGKNIANVHYKANYNGNVTEKHLCSDCAAKMGLNNNVFGEDMFNDFFDGFFGRDFFRPFGSFGMMPVMMPTMLMPRLEIKYDEPENKNAAEAEASNSTVQGADPELSKKRELNELRLQLENAIKDERFEDAATLRDKIKEIEK